MLSTFGWVAIVILFLMMLLVVAQMFVQMPKSDVNKRILAVTPMIIAILFLLLIPKDTLYINETTSSLVRTFIPFVGMAFSLPLILKAKKEIEKEN